MRECIEACIGLSLLCLAGLAPANAQCLPDLVSGKQKVSALAGGLGGPVQGGDTFGAGMANIGDLDGDGVEDLAVGAPGDDDGGGNSGAVYVLFMDADGTVKAEQKISRTSGGLTGPLGDGDQFGHSVGALGDVDGDGVADLVVGAPYDVDTGGTGSAWIVRLNPDGTVKAAERLGETSPGFVGAIDPGDYFGYAAVGGIGDLDGDGVVDAAVGAYGDDDGGGNVGAVWILFLNADGTLKSNAKISATSGGFAGPLQSGDNFGHSIAGLGDLDGDGVEDMAVGELRDAGGQGAVWILFLEPDGSVKASQKINEFVGGFGGVLAPNDLFGRSVANAGDLTGDGLPELIVGAPWDDDGGADTGAAWILSLDTDGTVLEELLISESSAGLGNVLSASDYFGRSVTRGGDLDGDGWPEVVVGAAYADDGGSSAGELWVLELRPENDPPSIACPGDVLVACDGPAGTAVVYAPPVATDGCDADPVVTCNPPSGSMFPLGVTTVVCFATDQAGNVAACTFEVTVVDAQPPTIDCPAPLLAECASPAGVVVSFAMPSATDDCDPAPFVVCVPPSGSVFPPGTTAVLCTATDASGNSATCSFDVVVQDTTAPTISCAPDLSVACTSPSGTPVSFSVTASDACDPLPVVVCTPPSGATFPHGTTSVLCTATDASGNVSTCSFDLTVEDTAPPVVVCPGDILTECSGLAGSLVSFSVVASDACDPAPAVVSVPPSGSVFPVGVTHVVAVATDASGNQATCGFDVTVVDATAPALVCPGDLVAEGLSPAGANVAFTVAAVDGCDPLPEVDCLPPSGSTFALGTTSVLCTATDVSGNVSTCGFDVTVVDTTPPALACPAPITTECSGPLGTPVAFTVTADDLCDPAPSVVCVPASGSVFPPGTTSVLCTATDASGNASSCSFDVVVQDTIAPGITCPFTNLVMECNSSDGALVFFPDPVVVDLCDPAPVVGCDPPSGSLFPPGVTTVTCTATDAAGNASTCAFTVTVQDTTAPALACPPEVVAECGDPTGTPVDFVVTASDACDPAPVVVCTPPPGSAFALGTTRVVCTATDESGNQSSCGFDVIVADTTVPVITCPPDLSITTEDGADVPVTFAVTASDACDPAPTVVCTPASGSTFPVGTTRVSCTATDAAGNESACGFDVTVSVFLCQTDLGYAGSISGAVTWGGGSAFEGFGQSLDFAGDVDGDGRVDVVTGTGGTDANGTQSGSVSVFSGSTSLPLFVAHGDAADDRLGTSVATAGDVDGDGLADVIAGARRLVAPTTGYARVFGADGAVLHTFATTESDTFYGYSVCGVGDVDGDGRSDLVVGAPAHDEVVVDGGRVTLYSGGDGTELWTLDGGAIYDQFGYSVRGVGDVDGDGLGDLVVGAPQLGPPPSYYQATGPGYARVVSGLDGSLIHLLVGDAVRDRFGFGVGAAGDVDADGVPDVIVGAPQWPEFGTPGRGYAVVFSGADGSELLRVTGLQSNEYLGQSVAGGGDVDGDGFDDVAVGAIDADGLAANTGRSQVVSGADGSTLFSTAGVAASDLDGWAVALGGDLDDDGLADVLVSRFFHDGPFTNSGLVTAQAPCEGGLGLVNPCPAHIALCGDDLTTAGSTATFTLTGGEPFAPLFLVLGTTFGPTPLFGGTLVPFPFNLVFPGLTLDASGSVSFPVTGGPNSPGTLYVQAVLGGVGFEFSNALAVTVGLP